MKHRNYTRYAFTLVELLVVVGIIAVLIAILLPALSRARAAANTIKCAVNLRNICQAMQIYASDNQGYFPGGPNTSGRFLNDDVSGTYNDDNCPEIINIWDWMSPIARTMGLAFNDGPSRQDKLDRFFNLATNKAFLCPDNDLTVVPYPATGGVQFSTAPMPSYTTSSIFHYIAGSGAGAASQHYRSIPPAYYSVPGGYCPKLTAIGPTSAKIFIADGAKWNDGQRPAPDADLIYNELSWKTTFTDVGPWSAHSYSWLRELAPGNGGNLNFDSRTLGFRHGKRNAGGPADSFRFNAGFFDGHVQTMGDLEASDPSFWMPTGSTTTASEATADVQKKYFLNGSHFVAN